MRKNIVRGLLFLLPAFVLSGCIVSDQVTTILFEPDGSAEIIINRSNIHSTKDGKEAERELRSYRKRFDAGKQWPLDRIRSAGGHVEEARWIRKKAPMANFVHAILPDESAIEKFASLNGKAGGWNVTTDVQNRESGGRLEITLRPPQDRDLTSPPSDLASLKQELASNFSHTRVVPVDGKITGARGFAVSEDRQSALLDRTAFPEKLWSQNADVTIWLEWKGKN